MIMNAMKTLSVLMLVTTSYYTEASQLRQRKGKIRGAHSRTNDIPEQTRILPAKKGSSSSSSYSYGCLAYSSSDLQSMWKFRGSAPDCGYVHHNDDDDDSGGGGGGGGGDDDESGGGGGGGGGNDDDGNGGGGNGGGGNGNDDDGNGGGGNGGGGDGGGDGGDDGETDVDAEPDCDGNAYTSEDNGGGDDEDTVYVDNEEYSGGDDDGGGSAYDPYGDFNIQQCDTYNNLWLWDLSLTCESEYSLENCECTMAQELIDMGSLSCDDMASCPADCSICATCMNLICAEGKPLSQTPVMSTSTLLYIIAGAIITLLTILLCCHCKRRREGAILKKGALGANLIETNHRDDDYEPPLPEDTPAPSPPAPSPPAPAPPASNFPQTQDSLLGPGGLPTSFSSSEPPAQSPVDAQQTLLGPGGLPTFIPVHIPTGGNSEGGDDSTQGDDSDESTVSVRLSEPNDIMADTSN